MTFALIWGSTNPQSTYLHPLIRTQKKIIRLIANKPPRTHTAPIMQKYRLHSLTSLYILSNFELKDQRFFVHLPAPAL